MSPPKISPHPTSSSSQGRAYSRSTQQQVLIRLQSSTVEFTLDTIQCFEALKSSLGILRQLLHWKQLLGGGNVICVTLAAPLSMWCFV